VLNKHLFSEIDDTIHTKARLGIMTLLVTQGELDFTQLKQSLDLSDGNLSAHIRVLEEAGYIAVTKSFIGRKPRTIMAGTPEGHAAYMTYLNQLESILRMVNNQSI
jgi:DNA-binding MarR family transcriptional regulator